jgi:DNA-binding transcriptional LysR family regulator
MDIELLKTFIEVTQVRHFGRAAENLFLTPAAVSARIRQLEQMLGVTLLHRTRGNIQMTTEGERLLPHARKLLHAWSDTLNDLSIKLESDNHLNIGAITSLWQCQLPVLMNGLVNASANHRLHIESHSHMELVSQLLAQQLDIALLLDLPQHPELHAIKIAEQELALHSSDTATIARDFPESQAYIYIEWSAAFAAFHHKRLIGLEPFLRTTEAALATGLMEQTPASAYLPVSNYPGPIKRVKDAPRFAQTIYAVYKTGREHDANLGPILAQLKSPTR